MTHFLFTYILTIISLNSYFFNYLNEQMYSCMAK